MSSVSEATKRSRKQKNTVFRLKAVQVLETGEVCRGWHVLENNKKCGKDGFGKIPTGNVWLILSHPLWCTVIFWCCRLCVRDVNADEPRNFCWYFYTFQYQNIFMAWVCCGTFIQIRLMWTWTDSLIMKVKIFSDMMGRGNVMAWRCTHTGDVCHAEMQKKFCFSWLFHDNRWRLWRLWLPRPCFTKRKKFFWHLIYGIQPEPLSPVLSVVLTTLR